MCTNYFFLSTGVHVPDDNWTIIVVVIVICVLIIIAILGLVSVIVYRKWRQKKAEDDSEEHIYDVILEPIRQTTEHNVQREEVKQEDMQYNVAYGVIIK